VTDGCSNTESHPEARLFCPQGWHFLLILLSQTPCLWQQQG
jgi:hypothetical protein